MKKKKGDDRSALYFLARVILLDVQISHSNYLLVWTEPTGGSQEPTAEFGWIKNQIKKVSSVPVT